MNQIPRNNISPAINLSSHLQKIQSFSSETRETAPESRSGRWCMEAVCCLDCMASHSAVLTRSKTIYDIKFGNGLAAGFAGELSVLKAKRLQCSIASFRYESSSIVFSVLGYDRKSKEVQNVVP